MNYKIIIKLIALLLCQTIHAQQNISVENLSKKEYQYLIEVLDNDSISKQDRRQYAEAYLVKAKSDRNWAQMGIAYKELLHLSHKDFQLQYSDSILYASSRTNDDMLKAEAYITKGNVYYNRKKYTEAWDNYIMAETFVSNTNDAYLKHNLKFNQAQIKYYLGFYDEAMGLFKECVSYFEKEDEGKPYLSSLHALSLCYYQTHRFDLCTATTTLGISKALEQNDTKIISYFTYTEGINQYFKKNYDVALSKLKEALPVIASSSDFANETLIYFYAGKCHWQQMKFERALPFLEKVENAFQTKKHITPELRENYELLIKYWSTRNNKKKQLRYINRLLQIDSILTTNYNYLSSKTHKDFDTKKLLMIKGNLEGESKGKTDNSTILATLITVLLIIIGFISWLLYKSKRADNRKFEAFINKDKRTIKVPLINAEPEPLNDIKPELRSHVLKQLEKFEREKTFLKTGMTLQKMAKMFDTNTTYLPRIILHYKKKKNTDYVNDLKIDHIIELLKTDTKYRNYSLRALADEAGFNSIQHFTTAFKNNTGFKPLIFINKLGDKCYNI